MKKFILASLVLASTVVAQAANITVYEAALPATRGQTSVSTKFHIDTDMKEGFAKIEVQEAVTYYVQDCSYGGGYGRPYPGPHYPGPGRGPGYPYPGPHYPGPICRSIPQTSYNTVLSDTVKIEGLTTNGDEVIFQGQNGDVVCGTMGRSRVFRVPTFYLSGKCDLDGKVYFQNGSNKVVVKFTTK